MSAEFRPLLSRPDVRAVFEALSPETTRIVGGAVRDALVGGASDDVDFATTLTPAETTARAEAAGLSVAQTGTAHGTVTVIARHVGFQVTTLRRDLATDGRRAVVAFGTDWTEDALRRDFTVNALYLAADGTLHDPLGGRDDVLSHRVRFIGDPDRRIAEDALRIPRFFRFCADFGEGRFDAEGLAACARGRSRMAGLSRERIRQELVKLIMAPHAAAALGVMDDLGILGDLLPGADVARFRAVQAAEASVDAIAQATVRLWALAVGPGGDASELAKRLALSKKEAAIVERLATRVRGLVERPDPPAARELLYRLGADDLARLVTAAAALSPHPRWKSLLSSAVAHPVPPFPLGARDIIARGVAPGPKVGQALRILEANWIEAGFPESMAERLDAFDWRALDEGGRS